MTDACRDGVLKHLYDEVDTFFSGALLFVLVFSFLVPFTAFGGAHMLLDLLSL